MNLPNRQALAVLAVTVIITGVVLTAPENMAWYGWIGFGGMWATALVMVAGDEPVLRRPARN